MALGPAPARPAGRPGPSRGGRGRGGGRGGRGHGPGRGGNRGAFSGALYQPSQTLSGQNLSTAANQLADAQTQGPLSELAAQVARNNQQGSAAGSQTFAYYMQLARQAQDSLDQERQIGSGLNNQLQGIGQDAQGQIAQFGGQAQSGALGRLGQLGLDGGQLGALQGETARQQQLGSQNAQAFRAAGATQGANYQGNAASNLGTFALRGQERLGNIAQATRLSNEPLNSKIAALQERRGALVGTALGQLRQSERNYSIASQGLGIKQQAVTDTAQNNKARNDLTARGQNIGRDLGQQRIDATIRGQNLSHLDRQSANSIRQAALNLRNSRGGRGGRGGGAKPLTTVQNNHVLGVLGKIENAVSVMQQQGIKDKSGKVITAHPSEGQIRQALSGIDPLGGLLIQAAYELNGWGIITPATARQLHAAGVRGGFFRGRPIRVGNPPKQKTGILGTHLFGIPV